MFDKISILKKKGYVPDAVLDMGAFFGTWTDRMRNLYPDADYYLFEPIDYSELHRFKSDKKAKVYNVLLSDKVGEVNWYQKKNCHDTMFMDRSAHFQNCDVIKRQTTDLDTLVAENNSLEDAKNIFIKIDCQGAEIPILKGCTSILDRTDFIVLEMPLFGRMNEGVPDFLDHLVFMDNLGFTTYDIIDNHYINYFNMQVDVLFINKNHVFNKIVNLVNEE